MDQQRAAVGDTRRPSRGCRRAPARSGGRRRCTARRSGRRRRRGRRRRTPHVAHPIGDAGRGEVGLEHLVVVGGLGGVTRRSPAARGRCRRAGRWPRPRRRRAPPTRARSSSGRGSCRSRRSRPPAGHRAAACVQARRPGRRVIQPSTSADSGQRRVERSHVAHRRYTPRPNDDRPTPRRAPAAPGRWRRPPPARLRGPARGRARSAAGRSASARSTARRTASRCRPISGVSNAHRQ